MSDRIDTEAPMDDEYFDRFLVCSVFGPPPEEVKRARAYIAALRSELDRTREALRAADDWMTYANGPYPYPTKLREQVRAVLGVQDTPEPKEGK